MRYYFLGIGGIGMSALARYFHQQGMMVSGYDRTPSPLTETLIGEGIAVHYQDNPELIPENIDTVIYTPAIPADNREFRYLQQKGIPMYKRSQILGHICTNDFNRTLAVAGSHGKTSTSSILTHLLSGDRPVSAFIGGIANNFNANYIFRSGADDVVVEADEYDRSFLTLHPYLAIITSMDADHLDIYGSQNSLIDAFNHFASQIHKQGYLITKPHLMPLLHPQCKIISYSLHDNTCLYHADNICISNGKQYFDIICPSHKIKDVSMETAGNYYIENAVAAVAAAEILGVNDDVIRKQLASFTGVKRRFDYIVKQADFIYIDDYAHHPNEIKACISSARMMHPDKHICGIFQPHLYTRTRDFADEFAQALSMLDSVALLDIYPARELPIEGINSQFLLDKITLKDKILLQKNEITDYIASRKPEVLLTMGAGDIDRMVNMIKERFAHE
ncbi:MAG: UDP-N-acetylmuramate--L-alanine ligase [Bacteroidales bacterium]|nr:UDP-N-acetylmuramate--L-alanine ligase [Bacteroidales bacterium]